jgi:hypothetical protein
MAMFGLTLLANRYVRIGLGVLAAAALLMLAVKCVRDDAAGDERARQAAQIERDKAAQRQRETTAEQTRRADEAQSRAAADQRRKEIDDATRNIPDQAPSARQRSRACVELRRQAEAAGRADPAC